MSKREETVITISKYWHNPPITITVSNRSLELEMKINDFVKALKMEIEDIGGITWVFKKDTFEAMVDKAVNKIIYGIKEESLRVV